MKKKTIALVGLWNADNLGDPLLCACTRHLISKELDAMNLEYEMREVDLNPIFEITSTFRKIRMKLNNKKLEKNREDGPARRNLLDAQVNIAGWLPKYREYFREQLKGADAVVFTGGGLIKFKNQRQLSVSIWSAVKVCEEMNIPVAFQACGVEGYDEAESGCIRLKEAINSPVTQVITTRDDINLLNSRYKVKESLVTAYSADSAVYASEMTGIEKDSESVTVGVNVARGTLFEMYGIPFSSEEVVELYCDIVKALERRRIKWTLFTNGLPKDNQFAMQILKKLGIEEDDDVLLNRAEEYDEMVKQIAGFRGVIAMRLHACITSYSLDIPAVGMCWNDKVRQFGEVTGYPERFFGEFDLDAEKIVQGVIRAMEEGYDEEAREKYRKTSENSANMIANMLKDKVFIN